MAGVVRHEVGLTSLCGLVGDGSTKDGATSRQQLVGDDPSVDWVKSRQQLDDQRIDCSKVLHVPFGGRFVGKLVLMGKDRKVFRVGTAEVGF